MKRAEDIVHGIVVNLFCDLNFETADRNADFFTLLFFPVDSPYFRQSTGTISKTFYYLPVRLNLVGDIVDGENTLCTIVTGRGALRERAPPI